VPIIALHLTRPAVDIPDRAALGMASHFEAARGAYLIRDYAAGQPKMGTILVQGTMSTYNTVRLLPKLDELGLNVKLVAVVSPELFRLQPKSYQDSILPAGDQVDLTYITNGSRRLMRDWITHRMADEYAMSSDWDNRWRTGGTVDEVLEEAHLSQDWLLRGIQRFVDERSQRLERLGAQLAAARTGVVAVTSSLVGGDEVRLLAAPVAVAVAVLATWAASTSVWVMNASCRFP